MRWGRAPAKLNLALELSGRRPDGYHELAAISQTIDWSDVVALDEQEEPDRPAPAIPELQIWGPEAHRVPLGPENLAVRAAVLLHQQRLGAPIRRLAWRSESPLRAGSVAGRQTRQPFSAWLGRDSIATSWPSWRFNAEPTCPSACAGAPAF